MASTMNLGLSHQHHPNSSHYGDDEILLELGPYDVLLGRGTGPNENQGNVRFRELLKATMAKYYGNSTSKSSDHAEVLGAVKMQVAKEVLGIWKVMDGHFVRKLNKEESRMVHGGSSSISRSLVLRPQEQAGKKKQNRQLYIVVSNEMALEKTKQSIRFQLNKDVTAAKGSRKEQEQGSKKKERSTPRVSTTAAMIDKKPIVSLPIAFMKEHEASFPASMFRNPSCDKNSTYVNKVEGKMVAPSSRVAAPAASLLSPPLVGGCAATTTNNKEMSALLFSSPGASNIEERASGALLEVAGLLAGTRTRRATTTRRDSLLDQIHHQEQVSYLQLLEQHKQICTRALLSSTDPVFSLLSPTAGDPNMKNQYDASSHTVPRLLLGDPEGHGLSTRTLLLPKKNEGVWFMVGRELRQSTTTDHHVLRQQELGVQRQDRMLFEKEALLSLLPSSPTATVRSEAPPTWAVVPTRSPLQWERDLLERLSSTTTLALPSCLPPSFSRC